MYSSFCDDFPKNGNFGDTALQLDGFGYGTCETSPFGKKQTKNSAWGNCMDAPDDGCKLVLGLGPTPCAYYDENSAIQVDKKKASTHGLFDAPHQPDQVCLDGKRTAIPIVDEGSTSAKRSGGYMTGLISTPRMENTNISLANTSLISTPRVENTNISLANKSLELEAKSHCQISQLSSEPSTVSSYSMGAVSEPTSVAVSSDHRGSNSKKCKILGCTKGARGATGLCISHGGGQRCQKVGCNKGAESRTIYCKAHGGGRRCQHLGCTKSAEGKTDLCIAHGGGRRCGHPGGCTKAARGKSGLCIRHGGGKRCKVEGCARSAEGQIGLCISHGGGRRCHFLGCTKGAQGSTLFCKAHGGGKRCMFAGCTKGAEGSTPLCKGHGGGKRCMFDGGGICPKSVHGGTSFCVAHGGGKRCAASGCTKSARGRTDCCVKHGGGKRCRFENCGKSAQGSTDFCKAHGGGKRCSWGEGKCEKFARGKSGLCAAHCRLAQGQETNLGGLIGPGLFHGLVPAVSTNNSACSSYGVSVISESTDSFEKPMKRQQLIPPQVLVPLSMKDTFFLRPSDERKSSSICGGSNGAKKVLELTVPEGRVHGGGLLSLLGGNLNNAINGI